MTGRTIAQYTVAAPLGAGGMGEVFRARDTRLQREVAIKFLPAEFGASPERLRRFDQETKTLAALNHPNILTIHDAGVHDSSPYLVSELLEGRTLREEIGQKPVPLRKAIDLALQIAQGLAGAHAAGITHRDLKPENIFLTKDGRIKILDFGLAKLNDAGLSTGRAVSSNAINSVSPTVPNSTLPGQILGTPSYMAPEQVRGEPADHRSDLFAFGCVLYEMLSGARAFQRDNSVAIMHAILADEPPDLETFNQKVSPALARLVAKCLAKDPEERWQTAKDLADELKWLALSGSQMNFSRPIAIPTSRRRLAVRLVFGAISIALAVSLSFQFLSRSSAKTREVHRFSIPVPLPEHSGLAFASVSPNGRHIAYTTHDTRSGAEKLWLRSLDTLEPVLLSDEGSRPFWSPDSRFVAFFANKKLKKIGIAGGPAQVICPSEDSGGGAWNRDGIIVFAPSIMSPLFKVSAEGGAPVQVTELQTGQPDQEQRELNHGYPQFLPDGDHFIYLARASAPRHSAIFVGSLAAKDRKLLVKNPANGWYASGHLLYLLQRTLVAQKFDSSALHLSGEPIPLAQNVDVFEPRGEIKATASENGVLACLASTPDIRQLLWVDRSGKELSRLPAKALDRFEDPWLSRDEKQVVLRKRTEDGSEIWLANVRSGTLARLTDGRHPDWYPLWSADGTYLIYASNRGGQHHLYKRALGGLSNEQLIYRDDDPVRRIKVPCDVSPDGRHLLYYTGRDWRLWLLPLDGPPEPTPLRASATGESTGVFSPDGKWIAFQSGESGTSQVYIQSFPAGEGRLQVSELPSFQPRWNPNGQEIFFITTGQNAKTLMAARISTNNRTLAAGPPEPLFQLEINHQAMRAQYMPAENGERFLIFGAIGQTNSTAQHPLTVVLNWEAILKKP